MAVPTLIVLSLLTASCVQSQECNGLNIENSFTVPAGVCMTWMEDGEITTTMIDCVGGNGAIKMWSNEDCSGNTDGTLSVEDYFGGINETWHMVCDGEDCPYVMVRSYFLENLTNITMVDGYNVTDGNSSSSSEEWEDFVDCDANDFENWDDTAVVMAECVPTTFGNITYHRHDRCVDGQLQMAVYTNSECSGSPLFEEDHFLNEGACPEANCSVADPVQFVDTESSEDDGAPRMQYLVGLAMVGLAIAAS